MVNQQTLGEVARRLRDAAHDRGETLTPEESYRAARDAVTLAPTFGPLTMGAHWVKVTYNAKKGNHGKQGKPKQVPNTPGLYLLVNKNGSVIYVGCTVNLFRRNIQHRGRITTRNSGWDKQYFVYCEYDGKDRLLYECVLIQRYQPRNNTYKRNNPTH